MLTTHCHLALRLRITGVFTSSSAVCLFGMDRDNFTFFLMQMCDGIVYEAQRNGQEILEISVWSRSNEQTCGFQMVEVF